MEKHLGTGGFNRQHTFMLRAGRAHTCCRKFHCVHSSCWVLHHQAVAGDSPRQAGVGHGGVAIAQRWVPRLQVSTPTLLHCHAHELQQNDCSLGSHNILGLVKHALRSGMQHSQSRHRQRCRCFQGRCQAAAHINEESRQVHCALQPVPCQFGVRRVHIT